MLNTPSELRACLQAIFAASPLTINGQTFGPEVTDEAIDEIIGAMVKAYMGTGELTACEKIVGAIFVDLMEKAN